MTREQGDLAPEPPDDERSDSASGSNEDDGDGDDDLGGDEDDFLRAIARVDDEAPPEAEPERTGEQLGHYRIEGKLGEGGMGIVYAAQDLKLRRKVALKVLPRSVVRDEDRRRRFLREARSASAVTHPNIGIVFEVGEAEDGSIFFAMEHVDGKTLRAILEDSGGPLEVPEALRIAREIVRGLAKAHARGIVHRDIKPENVMIADDGFVKLLDFGLAKIRSNPADGTQSSNDFATRDGHVMGTPSYMSPEQAKGKDVDARSDVFSVGIVLYEMLTGARPFAGSTPVEIAIAIDRDHPVPASKRNAEVPRWVEALVRQCLEKAPAERPADGRDLLRALEAPPPSARTGAAGSRRALFTGAGVLGAIGLVVALAWPRGSAGPPASPDTVASGAPSSTGAAAMAPSSPTAVVTPAPIPPAASATVDPAGTAASASKKLTSPIASAAAASPPPGKTPSARTSAPAPTATPARRDPLSDQK